MNQLRHIAFALMSVISMSALCQKDIFNAARTVSESIVEPSAEVTAMRRYVDCPVSYATGSASFSIPLVSLKTAKCGVSLALNYRCEAKKVNEQSGYIGLGWSISGLGSVSRQICGRPDEDKDKYLDMYEPKDPEDKLIYYRALFDNNKDASHDRFTVVTPDGESVSFILTWSNSIENYDITFLGSTELTVLPTVENGSRKIKSFTVINPDGYRYEFTEQEKIHYRFDNEPKSLFTKDLDYQAVAAWHISKIIAPERSDSITVSYAHAKEWTRSIGIGNVKNEGYYWPITRDGYGCGGFVGDIQRTGRIHTQIQPIGPSHKTTFDSPPLPEYIKASDGCGIKFTYNIGVGENGAQLTSIAHYHSRDINDRKISFESKVNSSRRFLEKLSIGGHTKVYETFNFEYFSDYNSGIGDIFGYPNGGTSSPSILDENLELSDSRKVNPGSLSNGLLRRISTSAGINTEFRYEPSTIALDGDTGLWGDELTVGLRIKEIETFDSVSERKRLRQFNYSKARPDMDIRSYGINDFIALSGSCFEVTMLGWRSGYCSFSLSATFTSAPRRAGKPLESMRILYGEVEETVSGTDISHPLKTRYEYDIDHCIAIAGQAGCGVPKGFDSYTNPYLGHKGDFVNNNDPDNFPLIFSPKQLVNIFYENFGAEPLLTKKTMYANRGDGYKPVTTETFRYRRNKVKKVLIARHYEYLAYQIFDCAGQTQLNIDNLDYISRGEVSAYIHDNLCIGSNMTQHYTSGKERTISTDYIYKPYICKIDYFEEGDTIPEGVIAGEIRSFLPGFNNDSIKLGIATEFKRPRGITYSFNGDTVGQFTLYSQDIKANLYNSRGLMYLPVGRSYFAYGNDHRDSIMVDIFYGRFNGLTRKVCEKVRRGNGVLDMVKYLSYHSHTGLPYKAVLRDGTNMKYNWDLQGNLIQKEYPDVDFKYDYDYDYLGQCVDIWYPSGKMEWFKYDNSRLVEKQNTDEETLATYEYRDYASDRENSITANTVTANGVVSRSTVYDGYGLPVKEIAHAFGGDDEDVVSRTDYDAIDRPVRLWQPEPDGQSAYYADSRRYTLNVYDADGSQNVVSVTAPGDDITAPAVAEYICNTASGELACRRLRVEGESLVCSGYHAEASLDVVRATDGNGHRSLTFTDWRGRTLLTRKVLGKDKYIDTYTVYTPIGDVALVLQPLGAAQLKDGTYSLAEGSMSQVIKDYAYVYRYDDALRPVYTKMPGTEAVTTIYDPDGLVAYTIDGNMRADGKCRFMLYDAIARPVVTGVCDIPEGDAPRMRANYKAAEVGLDSTGYVTDVPLANAEVYTATYYDYGGFYSPRYLDDIPAGYVPSVGTDTKVAYTLERVLGSSPRRFAATVYEYDSEERVIKTAQTFHTPGVCLVTENEYNIDGSVSVTENRLFHPAGNHTDRHTFVYDNVGRLLQERVSYDGAPEETVQHINYNAIGQVKSNYLGWFTENYGYNIRGALTSKSSPVFNQTVSFEGLNNGSIAKITDTLDGLSSTNTYEYDPAGRLWNADIKVGGNNRSTAYSYDANSNITYLMRWGADGAKDANMVDELYYEYDGNRVRNIYDCCGAAIHEQSMDFADGADDDIEYTYDANGNTLTDSNKGVKYHWDYNNMLKGVDYEIGIQDFTRTASGRLLCRTYSPNARRVEVNPEPFKPSVLRAASWGGVIGGRPTPSLPIIYNYHKYGHYEYTEDKFTRINTSTGYRDSLGTHVYVRDWQGNVRAVVSRDGGTTVFDQTTYYYPYGLPMAESTSPQTNPYKYTAKELLTDQSLNLADHGARMYDPAIARWLSRDPLSSTYPSDSHYIFCAGDPINCVDYSGMDTININYIDNKWVISNPIIAEGNDVFIVNNGTETTTHTFSEGTYGERVCMLNLEVGATRTSETLGVYHVSGQAENATGYYLTRGGDPSTAVGSGCRIPDGEYPINAPCGGEEWRRPGVGGNVVNRGVRFHYGENYKWSEGCFILCDSYTVSDGITTFNKENSINTCWNFDKSLGASFSYDYHFYRKNGKRVDRIGTKFTTPIRHRLILKTLKPEK